MRRLYTLLLYVALPVASLIVLVRGLREREYWRGGAARFGFGPRRCGGGIWVHAVSVGEVQAAAVLVAALREREPKLELTLSCATPTGRARAVSLMPGVDVRYAPYDLPGCARRYLARLRPRLLILIETELWPNLLREASRAGVPTLIASARLSARSARLYRLFPGLLRTTLAANVWVGAQSRADADRFCALGVAPQHLRVVGNIKFEHAVPPELPQRGAQLRARYAAGRPVWVAGSTRAGEEQIVYQAHRQLLELQPRALLILAPRHPQRFDEAAAGAATQGLHLIRRSRESPDAPYEVLLLDTLGELGDFYAAADVAFVGGSLVPVGGHNLIEPAALGLPVLTGPQQFNSPEIARVMVERGALGIVRNAAELAAAVAKLLADPPARAQQGAAGRAVIRANRGALAGLLALVDQLTITVA